MGWQYTPYALGSLATAIVSAGLAVYVLRRLGTPGARMVALYMVAVTIWGTSYAVGLSSTDLSVNLFWSKVAYVGIVIVPVAWFGFAAEYTGRERWLTRRNLALLSIVPLVTLALVFTNEMHHLYWSEAVMDPSGPFVALDVTYGVGCWAWIAYSYMLLLAGAVLVVSTLASSETLYTRQGGVLLFGVAAPWLGNAAYVFGLNPIPDLDLTPYFLLLTGMAVVWAIPQFRLFDVVPVARAAVVERMSDGMIVLDEHDRILDMNPASQWLSKLPASKAIGLPVEQVVSNEDIFRMVQGSVDEAAGQIKVGDGPARRDYEVTVSALRDHGREAVRFLVVRDVTERVSRELLFRLLVENASDMIAIYDASGAPRYISPSIKRVLGYEPGEALAAIAAPEIIHPEDRAWVRERREQVRSRPGEHPSIIFRVRHKDGSWRYVEGVANNRRADPEVRGVVASWRDVTQRVESEREIRRLNETLEKRVVERTERLAESESRLKELVGKLVAAQEEERRRVAYEIHDGLTQVAIAAHQNLQVFARAHPPGTRVEEGELDRTLALAQRTVREARHVIEGLRPTSLDDFGLAAALRLEVEELQEEGWEIACEEDLGEKRLDPEIETALFRVAREALTNARKHARTTRAAVKLSRESEEVRLEITDRGRGFDPSVASRRGPGEKVGLAGMRERVALLGGVLAITSRPGSGTTVTAVIPLEVPLEYSTQQDPLHPEGADTKALRRPYRER